MTLPAGYGLPSEQQVVTSDDVDSDDKTDKELPFPAWPEITERWQPLCFPTLLRARYVHHRETAISDEQLSADATAYLVQFEEVVDHRILGRATGQVRTALRALRYLRESGRIPKSRQLAAFRRLTPTIRSLLRGRNSTRDLWNSQELAWHSLLTASSSSFHGVEELFGFAHEIGHVYGGFAHGGRSQREQSDRVYALLDHIVSMPDPSPIDLDELWQKYDQENQLLVHLCKRIEPIEEIYANYIGLRFTPPQLRSMVEDQVLQVMSEQNLNVLHQGFTQACDGQSLISPQGAALILLDMTSQMVARADLDVLEATAAVTAVFSYIWQAASVHNLNEIDHEQVDAEVFGLLERARIPPDVFEAAMTETGHSMDQIVAIVTQGAGSQPKASSYFPPMISIVGFREGIRVDSQPLIPTSEGQNETQLKKRVVFEALRQQLSLGGGVACPLAWNGQPCCGNSKALWNLWDRLPDAERTNRSPPLCPCVTTP